MSSQKRKAGTQAGADAKKAKPNASLMSYFSSSPPSSQTASKFDKHKWVTSLTPEQRGLLTLEITTLHTSWLAVLKDELVTKEFLDLKRFLAREMAGGKKVFPPKEDIYSW